jgi:hypothetical protein
LSLKFALKHGVREPQANSKPTAVRAAIAHSRSLRKTAYICAKLHFCSQWDIAGRFYRKSEERSVDTIAHGTAEFTVGVGPEKLYAPSKSQPFIRATLSVETEHTFLSTKVIEERAEFRPLLFYNDRGLAAFDLARAEHTERVEAPDWIFLRTQYNDAAFATLQRS